MIKNIITDPLKRRRFSVYLIAYLTFAIWPNPHWGTAYASAVEQTILVKTTNEQLLAVDTLRADLALRAVQAIGLKVRTGQPYSGLTKVQANSVLTIAEHFGTEDFNDAVRVAYCESRLIPEAINRSNGNRSVDRGLFQLNSGGTMQRLGVNTREAFDADSNAAAAKVLFEDRGWQPWVCAHKLGIHR